MKNPKQTIRPKSNGAFPIVKTGWYDFCLGNGTQYQAMIVRGEGDKTDALGGMSLFVGVIGKGCHWFDSSFHATYIKEKLNLNFLGDAECIADFISCQFENGSLGIRQGSYEVNCCYDSPNFSVDREPTMIQF